MESIGPLLSPVALLVALLWNFGVLASVQLTVRLIRAFSVGRTLAAAGALTALTVPITIAYVLLLGRQPALLPIAMAGTALAGYVIGVRVLRIRRRRSALLAALGIGLLAGPWGAFLVN